MGWFSRELSFSELIDKKQYVGSRQTMVVSLSCIHFASFTQEENIPEKLPVTNRIPCCTLVELLSELPSKQ
jgi:hypothetical protein